MKTQRRERRLRRTILAYKYKLDRYGDIECRKCGHPIFRLRDTIENDDLTFSYVLKCNNCGALCTCSGEDIFMEEVLQ